MKVLNFGSLNYDYVYHVNHILKPGETLASDGMETFSGGKGLNQSIALAKAGVLVYHAGAIGEEGEELVSCLEQNGVCTDYILKCPGKSGHTVIQVDENAQNSILLYGGANRKITKEYVDDVLSLFGEGDFLILQNEINQLDYIIDKAYEKRMQIVLNPSPFDSALLACDLKKISYFVMNEIEGEEITKTSDRMNIIMLMKEKYPKASVLLTLGEKGSIYYDGNSIHEQEIYKVKAVDTTAAGDTFTGYFVAGLIEGMEPKAMLQRCAKASGIAVTRKGAAPSIPTALEVLKFE